MAKAQVLACPSSRQYARKSNFTLNYMLESKGKIYIGVYGICIQDSKVLCIKKARGPYTGLFDLPGGGIEFREPLEACLERELWEETTTTVSSKKFLGVNEFICDYVDTEGVARTSHHVGMYYTVELDTENIKTDPDGEDSLGAVWLPLETLDETLISPIAYPMIMKALGYRQL